MTATRLELHGLKRLYRSGEETIEALAGVDLVIEPGEMVAIIGASGSGKSTLMNILGCLDRPSAGVYKVDGIDVSTLDPDGLARLRRDHFGFVFQRYHLIGALPAVGNVELPGIYAGMSAQDRKSRAKSLMTRLGLGDRLSSRPNQLSGGQQQRVAIARALMNGGGIILADEPTGALDSRSGETVLGLLKELNRDGHTVIIVTHDRDVAAHAARVISIADGHIVSDVRQHTDDAGPPVHADVARRNARSFSSAFSALGNAVVMSLRAMATRKLRTALTMIGIVIGITAVVLVIGLGEGARLMVMKQLSDLGTSTISIYPGRDFSDPNAARIVSLTTEDSDALAAQPYVDSATPEMIASLKARYEAVTADVQASGIGPAYFRANGLKLISGRTISSTDMLNADPNVVLSDRTATALFKERDALGRTVLIDKAPWTVVGVVASHQSAGKTLSAYTSYTALRARLMGNTALGSIVVRIKDGIDTGAAERTISSLLTRRHGVKDFFIFNQDQIRRSTARTMSVLSLLIVSLAVVALVVGGIGVMNIMLITVTERTREIGLRMAVGARRSDIMTQFMIEAVAVCLVGGAVGIAFAIAIAVLSNLLALPLPVILSWHAILLALGFTIMIGLIFGYLPARNAARLDPVEALTRE